MFNHMEYTSVYFECGNPREILRLFMAKYLLHCNNFELVIAFLNSS